MTVIGQEYLKEEYSEFDDGKAIQPCGIDLRVGKIYNYIPNGMNGLYEGQKFLPDLEELKIDGKTYMLAPKTSYLISVDRQMKIPRNQMQLYLPRSSLLRGGVDVRTAVGDCGYEGTLMFLIENKLDAPFYLEKGERFCQAICFEVSGSGIYNGDYQNDKHMEDK